MAVCPVCQADIQDDFGLVTCKSCGSTVLLDFDGAAANPAPSDAQASPADDSPNELFTSPVDAVPQPKTPGFEADLPPIPESPDMSDLQDFGNSDTVVASAAHGSLKFNLFVSGLDSVDIRKALLDNLNDAKFGWNAEQIVSRIKNGELRIEALTPVKCAIIVQRLRSIPVDLRWEQYAIQQI